MTNPLNSESKHFINFLSVCDIYRLFYCSKVNSYIFNYNYSSGSILFDFFSFFHEYFSISSKIQIFIGLWILPFCWRSFYPNITTFTNRFERVIETTPTPFNIWSENKRKKTFTDFIYNFITSRNKTSHELYFFYSFMFIWSKEDIRKLTVIYSSGFNSWNCKLFDICLELIISRTK